MLRILSNFITPFISTERLLAYPKTKWISYISNWHEIKPVELSDVIYFVRFVGLLKLLSLQSSQEEMQVRQCIETNPVTMVLKLEAHEKFSRNLINIL